MGLFEGKTSAERNKIIAAIVLGTLAVISLTYTFGGVFFSSTKPVATVTGSPSPLPNASAEPVGQTQRINRLPALTEIENLYASVPINFVGNGASSVPLSGRNIFAFWEPGDPTPVPISTPKPLPAATPIPTPDYKIFLSFVTPPNVYAGSKEFRLEVNGDKFSDDSRIIFNGVPLQTTFISEQRLAATISETFINRPSTGTIMVDSPKMDFFSRQVSFLVQAPPKPEFEYIGMIARQHYNNDTAYFQEKGAKSGNPFSARLDDVVKGRFRVISISEKAVEFVDTTLGFKHRLALLRPEPGNNSSSESGYGDSPAGLQVNPPGIPANIRRVNPRRNRRINRSGRPVQTPINEKIDDTDN